MSLNTYKQITKLVVNMNKTYNYVVVIELDEDGIYVVKVPDISGCYTQGKTVEEVMTRIKEAIQVCLN